MNNELTLLIKKHTDTLLEETKTKPRKLIEFKVNKQKETSSFLPPIYSVEEEKWLLAVTSFEVTNSVFNITNKNKCFSIAIPGHWNSESAEKTIDEIIEILELSSQNDIGLHVEQV